MADVPTSPSLWRFSSEQEKAIEQMFAEMQRLNAQIQSDQAEIERLRIETRIIAAHTDSLLDSIEAQLTPSANPIEVDTRDPWMEARA